MDVCPKTQGLGMFLEQKSRGSVCALQGERLHDTAKVLQVASDSFTDDNASNTCIPPCNVRNRGDDCVRHCEFFGCCVQYHDIIMVLLVRSKRLGCIVTHDASASNL
jgi:hypothetical protein